MGLLDSFNFDDPRTMGLLSAAGGMLNASGPSLMPRSFGQVLGAGLQGGMAGYQGAQDRQQSQAMAVEKLKMLQLQEQRAQAEFDNNQSFVNRYMNRGRAPNGIGAVDASGSPQTQQVGTEIDDLDMLRAGALSGVKGIKDLIDIHKYENEPRKLESGSTYIDRRSGAERTMPKLDNGITMRPDGSAGYIPGYAQSVADQAGMTTGAQEAAKARYNTTTLNLPGGPRMVSNAQLPNMLNGGGQRSGLDVSRLAPQHIRYLQQQDPEAFANGVQSFGASGGPGVALQSDAEKEAQVGAVKTANDVDKARQLASQESATKAGKLYQQLSAAIPMAKTLLKDATGSGIGSLVDTGMNFVGASTPSSEAANQLETLSGWMTSNVPRMEGPQSNADVEAYKTMSAKVGDRSLPAASRLKALETLEALQNKYAEINGIGAQQQNNQPAGKTATLADIAATAKASGKTTAEVTKALRAKGYAIGGK